MREQLVGAVDLGGVILAFVIDPLVVQEIHQHRQRFLLDVAAVLEVDAERIELAWWLALGRPPTEKERDRAAKFLQDSPLSELCRGLFNLNEFIYVD